MTEAEWLNEPDLFPLDQFVRQSGDQRRLRLVACACVHADWEIAPAGARRAIQAGEALVDGTIALDELALAKSEATRDFMDVSLPEDGQEIARRAVWLVHQNAIEVLDQVLWQGTYEGGDTLRKRRASVILDIFGNPFRPVALDPAWLTSTVVALAQQMYESRDFSPMPILADALQDAGCENADILNHCRGPGEHVRGCWVVDLLTGRK